MLTIAGLLGLLARLVKTHGFYVHVPDLGKHIEITSERKKTVDDTIREVVKGHPCTQVKK